VSQDGRVLTVIVCGAGPGSEVGQLIRLAQEDGWTVQVVATPAALDFLDVPAIEALTGSPVRSQYRKPGEPRSRPADATIVAPATYNTITSSLLPYSTHEPWLWCSGRRDPASRRRSRRDAGRAGRPCDER
jgi:hypothetical protein